LTMESIALPNGSGLFRVGHTFDGWNTNPDGAGTSYAAGGTYSPAGSITLYAVYNAFKDPSEKVITISQTTNNDGSITLSIAEFFDKYEWFTGEGTKLAEGQEVTIQVDDQNLAQGINYITAVVSTGAGADAMSWSKEVAVYVND